MLADLLDVERITLRRDGGYGWERSVLIGDRTAVWLPLKHPGQRSPGWEEHHRRWSAGLAR